MPDTLHKIDAPPISSPPPPAMPAMEPPALPSPSYAPPAGRSCWGVTLGKFVVIAWFLVFFFNLALFYSGVHASRGWHTVGPIVAGASILFVLLLAVSALVGGIQKGRIGLAILGMLLTFFGYVFVLLGHGRVGMGALGFVLTPIGFLIVWFTPPSAARMQGQ